LPTATAGVVCGQNGADALTEPSGETSDVLPTSSAEATRWRTARTSEGLGSDSSPSPVGPQPPSSTTAPEYNATNDDKGPGPPRDNRFLPTMRVPPLRERMMWSNEDPVIPRNTEATKIQGFGVQPPGDTRPCAIDGPRARDGGRRSGDIRSAG
jgi:hypothetical protein